MEKKLMVSILLDFYGALLTDKQREIMDYYYNDDLSLSEISDNIGITRQGVHDNVRRAEIALYEMEKKLGLYSRFEQVQKTLTEIETLTKEICEINLTENGSAFIKEKTDRILTLTEALK